MNDFWRTAKWIQPSVSLLAKSLLALVVFSLVCGDLTADAQVVFSGGQPSPEQIKKMQEMRARARAGRGQPTPPAQKKPEEKKPEKKDEKKEDKKKEEEIKTVKRPTDGSAKLDPNRMRLRPDKNGLVQFNYNGHPWAEVLQEFADAAKFSFDWQELPADSLNLVTQQKYNLREARDLLNRHLIARGFTLVVQGEVLSAVKIDKLDPSLVPRVEADELEDFLPHDLVRVRFQLPKSMDPNKAKDDVKVLLSPKAKVIPLLNTKRLLVIDTVINLRSVRDLLYDEQTAADSIIKPRIRPILHRRADYVADQVMIVLGLDPASRKTPQELQIEQQRMQLFMQMQQKGKDVTKLLKKDGPAVHIAVDRQENVLLINAPPDLMATIERTIDQIDQPPGGHAARGSGERTMRRHKVASATTDAVVTALMEIGNLDPRTQLQSDSKSSIIFAFANDADHQKIEDMIGKLDGSGREIHVIQLRRVPARNVAGTLTSLLVGEEKKKDDNSRRRYYYPFGMQQDNKEEVGFKAQADVENNRLILWANADEMVEVWKMLVELGEPPEGKRPKRSNMRVLQARSPEETARLLEQLKATYPGKLNIDLPESKKTPDPPKEDEELKDKVTKRSPKGERKFVTVQHAASTSGDANSTDQSESAPSVNVTVTKDGRIVITGDDLDALDQLEELADTFSPPPPPEFHSFALKYASASSVVANLEEYFADELKDQTESVFDEWGQYEGKKEKDLGRATLGRRQLLRFVYHSYTNTVVVQGASASQLAAVKHLIDIYDRPPESDLNYYARETQVVSLKYSRAQDIASSLKEVYRELLSSKDKEFQDKEGNQPLSGRKIPYAFGEVRLNERGEEDPVLIEFEGVLSIGVDAVSNTLIISARKEVMDDIKNTVRLLDEAAFPETTIHVHRVGGGIRSAGELQKMLKQSMSQPWPGGKPLQAAAKAPSGEKPQEKPPAEERSSDRRRRGR